MPRDGRQARDPFSPSAGRASRSERHRGFSRIGLSVRSRVLPEFTGCERPSFADRVALVTGPPPDSAALRPSNWHAWAEPCTSWPVLPPAAAPMRYARSRQRPTTVTSPTGSVTWTTSAAFAPSLEKSSGMQCLDRLIHSAVGHRPVLARPASPIRAPASMDSRNRRQRCPAVVSASRNRPGYEASITSSNCRRPASASRRRRRRRTRCQRIAPSSALG